jgi:peptide deformylase
MKLKILQVGAPVLRQPAHPLPVEEIQSPPIQQLIELMRETTHDAPGVGLAGMALI